MALRDGDLPALYRSADRSSLDAQRRFRNGTAALLALLLVAAVGELVTTEVGPSSTDWGSILAATALIASLIVRASLGRTRPEAAWYGGRALAESVKSLAVQYAVAGGDYDRGRMAAAVARWRFCSDLDALRADIGGARPFEASTGAAITEAMSRLRVSDLETRRRAYCRERLADQRAWYASRARRSRSRARRIELASACLLLAGGVTAVLKAADVVQIGLLGLLATGSAALIAWSSTRGYHQLDEAYSLASHDLAVAEVDAARPRDEGEWARFVARAERAISREHTMWRAARTAVG